MKSHLFCKFFSSHVGNYCAILGFFIIYAPWLFFRGCAHYKSILLLWPSPLGHLTQVMVNKSSEHGFEPQSWHLCPSARWFTLVASLTQWYSVTTFNLLLLFRHWLKRFIHEWIYRLIQIKLTLIFLIQSISLLRSISAWDMAVLVAKA